MDTLIITQGTTLKQWRVLQSVQIEWNIGVLLECANDIFSYLLYVDSSFFNFKNLHIHIRLHIYMYVVLIYVVLIFKFKFLSL